MAISQENKQFYKKLFKVVFPIIISGIIANSLNLLDNLMVGRLGDLALSSVGIAGQVNFVQWMMTFGFCSGCSTFYAQFWGNKDLKNIKKVIGVNWCFTVPVGIIFFLCANLCPEKVMSLLTNIPELIESSAVYLKFVSLNFLAVGFCQPLYTALKATQQTKIPMLISSSSFIIDVLFNYLLIFGNLGFPALGVKGAALATGMARTYEVIVLTIVVFVRKNKLSGSLKEYFSFSKEFVGRVLGNTIPTTCNESLWGLATATYSAIYGRLDVASYAAVQACSTILDVLINAGFSMGDASLIFIGESLGKGDKEEGYKISKRLLKLSLVISIAIALIVIGAGPFILKLFTLTADARAKARLVLLVKAAGVPFNVLICIFVSGIFRSGGDTRFAAVTEISTMYLVGIPCVYLAGLVLGLPVHWVIAASYIENIVKLSICWPRYKSGKWLNNVIKGM